MRPIVMMAGLAVAVSAPAAAEARNACDQYAHNRKVTGTVVGGVAGGLLGNAVAARGVKTEGTLLGAGVGAVVGNQMARVKCDRGARASYRNRNYQRSSYARGSRDRVGYDSRAGACRYETRAFYDQYGELVHAPTRVCGN
jgi:uncharacterized protein YcfJ